MTIVFKISSYMSLFLCLQNGLQAQVGKRILDRGKREAEHQVNKKVDQQIDKGVKKLDTLLTGKKTTAEKKEPQKTDTPPATNDNMAGNKTSTQQVSDTNSIVLPTANEFARQMNTEWITDIIFTNIKCDKGKRSVEKKLSATTGVKSVQVNIQSGELTIAYFNSSLQYEEIIAIINQLYFDADGKKGLAGKNGCQ